MGSINLVHHICTPQKMCGTPVSTKERLCTLIHLGFCSMSVPSATRNQRDNRHTKIRDYSEPQTFSSRYVMSSLA